MSQRPMPYETWRTKDERARISVQISEELADQEDLVQFIERVLLVQDPMALNYEVNTDEYRPEAQTITLRLPEATNDEALLRIVHEEFQHWFGRHEAGPISRYRGTAYLVWERLQEPPEV